MPTKATMNCAVYRFKRQSSKSSSVQERAQLNLHNQCYTVVLYVSGQKVPWVRLKAPIPMHTNLHACNCEANQNSVTMPRLKQRLQVILCAQKVLRSHLRASDSKTFSLGSIPPDPPGLILRAKSHIRKFGYKFP